MEGEKGLVEKLGISAFVAFGLVPLWTISASMSLLTRSNFVNPESERNYFNCLQKYYKGNIMTSLGELFNSQRLIREGGRKMNEANLLYAFRRYWIKTNRT